MTGAKLWGEIVEDHPIDQTVTLVPAERLLPAPYTLQCTYDDTPDLPVLRPPLNARGDNAILHSIDLLEHNKTLKNLCVTTHNKLLKAKGHWEVDPLPQPPTGYSKPPATEKGTHQNTDMISLKFVTIPDISHDTAKILLKKSAASVACHAGYSTSTPAALSVLSECLSDYLTQFCLTLHDSHENISSGLKTNYLDAFEDTLHSRGIAGYSEFVPYVKSITTDFTAKLDNQRLNLEEEYKVISKTSNNSARTMPGHTDKVFVVDVLKGKFDPEPESPTQNIEGSFSEGLFTMNDSNGMFF